MVFHKNRYLNIFSIFSSNDHCHCLGNWVTGLYLVRVKVYFCARKCDVLGQAEFDSIAVINGAVTLQEH